MLTAAEEVKESQAVAEEVLKLVGRGRTRFTSRKRRFVAMAWCCSCNKAAGTVWRDAVVMEGEWV